METEIYKEELTVLSFGAGQDSTDILYRIVRNPSFKQKYVKGRFIVVMSDTGNEHYHTYEHVQFIINFCQQRNIEFYFLTNGEYHPRTWPTLVSQYQRNDCIMSLVGPRSCTDNLKIKPIYDFIDHYIAKEYYLYPKKGKRPKGKKFIKRFASDHGKINVIIGIAAGEEHRLKKSSEKEKKAMQINAFKKWKDPIPVWFRMGINKVYPLIEESITRWDIHEHIKGLQFIDEPKNWPLPYPSNCMFCPYMTKIEVLWLYRNHPDMWDMWVQLEANKIRKCEGNGKKNLGVKGDKLLTEFLNEAIIEFGSMTDEEIDDHKMSHGHCVMSTY